MLVLSRKNGQKIIINDVIEITILDSKIDNCKIAINAPKDVKIYREEVYALIQAANKESESVSIDALGNLSDLMPKNTNEQKLQNKKVIIKKKTN
ncbi:carbon storage regulator CsrA [bacterium]|nr:carbon storage regulator CsrA [bacterium]